MKIGDEDTIAIRIRHLVYEINHKALYVLRNQAPDLGHSHNAFTRDFLIDALLLRAYPLPTSGCLVGITVLSRTFASFGRFATVAT